ncbi:Rep [uncultured virus]|uniref:Rep n=1 Tax=uncultured virus TaxID=340016 RepID=A0A2K9LSR9_9VIRU|nr:Rep [uncultured virus]
MQVETVTTAPQTTQKVAKAKHWAGCTLNNYTPQDEARFLANIQPLADYYVYGKEVAPSGTPHLQFMVCFKKQTSSVAVQKLLKAAWFVKSAKSTMQQASDYCKKDGNFVEFGTLPLDQTVKSRQIIADKYADTIAKAKADKMDEIIPEHQLRYYKTIKAIQADHKIIPKNLDWINTPNIWIYGPTGMRRSKG